jgi:hypothetical protein
MANVVLGALLAVAGLRLFLSGGAGWCPFDGMSGALTMVVGAGLVVGAILLFAARTALVGLLLLMLWVLFWTWTPSRTLWGHGPCWQSAIALAGLFLNMGLIGLSDREGRLQRGTGLMLFFGLGFLGAGIVLWLRGG